VLPAVNRLRRAEDYRATARRGARAGRPLIVVHLLVDHTMPSANPDEPARVGFTVGRSVGGAVVRNAVRRRLRHLMRDRLASLPAGSQVVVRAQAAAATVPSAALAAELDDALTRAMNRAGEQR
jgi:ribonuclease P protein component